MLLAILAYQSASVALLGFELDSLIEIGASTVVIWELTDTKPARQRDALRLIGWAFIDIQAGREASCLHCGQAS